MTTDRVLPLLTLIEQAPCQLFFLTPTTDQWPRLRDHLDLHRAEYAAVPVAGPKGTGFFVVTSGPAPDWLDRTILSGLQASVLLCDALRQGGTGEVEVSEEWARAAALPEREFLALLGVARSGGEWVAE